MRRRPIYSPITCEDCGVRAERTGSSQRRCRPCRFKRVEDARRRPRSHSAASCASLEASDERWESRALEIEEGLARGASAATIADDIGVKVESLLRQCVRRGRMDLHDTLAARSDTTPQGRSKGGSR